VSYALLHTEFKRLGSADIAASSQRFFKTGPGEYGYGDKFHGIRVPELRRLVKRYKHLSLVDTRELLYSPFHEERLFALFLLVQRFETSHNKTEKKGVVDFYLEHKKQVNNWDLVDSSAHKIVGAYLFHYEKEYKLLHKLASQERLWDRRIAIIACFYFIKQKHFDTLLVLAEQLLHDSDDLIHKAVGWMLREAGKQDIRVLTGFLNQHASVMPRTMLRYAIEKLSKAERQHYMSLANL